MNVFCPYWGKTVENEKKERRSGDGGGGVVRKRENGSGRVGLS